MRYGLKGPTPEASQRGLTLLELMISMAIGLLLIAGVITVFLSTQQANRTQDAVAAVQEPGRFVSERLSRDLRQAGFLGCNNRLSMERPRSDGPLDLAGGGTIRSLLNPPGIDASGNDSDPYFDWRWNLGTTVRAGTTDGRDWVRVVGFGDDMAYRVVDHDLASAQFTIPPGSGIAPRDIVLVVDCRGGAIFEVTSTETEAESGILKYAASGGSTSGNWTTQIGRQFDEAARVYRLCEYSPDAAANTCAPADAATLANRTVGGALEYRHRLEDGQLVIARSDAFGRSNVADAAEGFRVSIGRDTGTGGLEFVRASAAGPADWPRVRATRVEMLLSSGARQNVLDQSQTLTFDGDDWTAPDRRFHQVFETTQAMRNRND